MLARVFTSFNKGTALLQQYVHKLVFLAIACCMMVFRSAKHPEAIHFHSNPYY